MENEIYLLADKLAAIAGKSAANGCDVAIAVIICSTVAIVAIAAICAWFCWKLRKSRFAEAAAMQERTSRLEDRDLGCRTELLNKLLKALDEEHKEMKESIKNGSAEPTKAVENNYIKELRAQLHEVGQRLSSRNNEKKA